MASIPGRPYTVGFNFRIISAPAKDETKSQSIISVMEYRYDRSTFTLVPGSAGVERLNPAPYELAKGAYLEFTANEAHNDEFIVVTVNCSDRCEVRILISVFCILLLFYSRSL